MFWGPWGGLREALGGAWATLGVPKSSLVRQASNYAELCRCRPPLFGNLNGQNIVKKQVRFLSRVSVNLGSPKCTKRTLFWDPKTWSDRFSGFCCQQGRDDIHMVKPTCFEENPGRRLSKNVIIIEFGQQKRC